MSGFLATGVQRALHSWFLISRGLTLGVRGVILDGEERIFLVRHTYTAGWHMPGGGVEPGEDVVGALGRELREEACIELGAKPTLHGIFFNLNARVSRRDHVVVFVVRDFVVLGEKRPDREIAEAGFFRLDALPEGTTRGTRARLAEIVGGAGISTLW